MMNGLGPQTRNHPFRDGSVSVLDAGVGPTLFVLHGIMGTPSFSPFLERLAERHRVVAPSLPGFMPSAGRADIRDLYDWVFVLSEIVDSLDVVGAPVVASSVGAMLAFELAALRQDTFSALALIAPLGLWSDDDPVADLFAATPAEQPRMLLEDPSKADAFFLDVGDDSDTAIEHGVSRYRTMRSTANLIWPIPERGLVDRLRRVQNPTGLIWGAQDKLISSRYAERFARLLPNALGTAIIGGAGHAAEWDQPDAVAAAVETFLSQAVASATDRAA